MYSLSTSPLVGRLCAGNGKYTLLKRILLLFICITVSEIVAAVPLYRFLMPVGREVLAELALQLLNGSLSQEAYISAVNVLADTVLGSVPAFVLQLWGTLATIGGCVFFVLVVEGKPLSSAALAEKPKRGICQYILGALCGILLLSCAVGIISLTRAAAVTEGNFRISALILLALGYVIQGASEEILIHGVLLTLFLGRGERNPWIALVSTSALFALLHFGNSGVTLLAIVNLFLFGVVGGLLTFRCGNVFAACGLHSFWNLAQGCLFGISVSGTPLTDSFFFTAFAPGRALTTGGAFGIEGGFATTLVLLLSLLLLLFLPGGKKTASASA